MLTVSEALDAIVKEVQPFSPGNVNLNEALGLVLAEKILSDVDSPPFDKALMDGFAVRSEDITAADRELIIVDEVTAGRTPSRAIDRGQATRIMTGAPIPDGADAVIKVEDTEDANEADRVRILVDTAKAEQNLIRQGTNMRTGDVVLDAGRNLRAQELAALAEMGCHQVPVRRKPTMAVLATGDELVPVNETPGPGQIRNSNEAMLVAQIQQAGGIPVPLGIARDEPEHLREKISAGLENDILLLSGGVSAGKLDLVPSELARAGVEQIFHKVQVKPGKPIWFGLLRSEAQSTLVFGLPGNPVSSMVCFELFVRTAVRRLAGIDEAKPQLVPARLNQSFEFRDTRETYFPTKVVAESTGLTATLMNWHGSSDLQSTRDANAMAVFPPGPRTYQMTDIVNVIYW